MSLDFAFAPGTFPKTTPIPSNEPKTETWSKLPDRARGKLVHGPGY